MDVMIIRHMKFWFSYFVSIVLLMVLASIVAWISIPYLTKGQHTLVSPLPNFLTLSKNIQVSTLDLWKPLIQEVLGSESPPQLTATAAFMYDLDDNKVLFDKDSKKRVPMASLTKVMTAIIALENRKSDDTYIVPGSALVGEDSMGLTAGEKLSMEELLYGLFLRSGNDAAEVFAANYPGGRQAFIDAMNQKAKALGLSDTNFTNPTGLQGDGDQYTTAYDLLVITRYALKNFPEIEKAGSTFSITIPATSTHKEFYMENETNLISTYPGVKGLKTGYTPEAGLCLITYLDYHDKKIVGVLLNSQNRRQEMVELLNYSLKSLGITPPRYTGSTF